MKFPKKLNRNNLIYIIIIFFILIFSVRYFKIRERFHIEEPILKRIKEDCCKIDDRISSIEFYP